VSKETSDSLPPLPRLPGLVGFRHINRGRLDLTASEYVRAVKQREALALAVLHVALRDPDLDLHDPANRLDRLRVLLHLTTTRATFRVRREIASEVLRRRDAGESLDPRRISEECRFPLYDVRFAFATAEIRARLDARANPGPPSPPPIPEDRDEERPPDGISPS
jgi:hypothetical protein